MKKLALIIMAFLLFAGGLLAQNNDIPYDGRPRERVQFDPRYGGGYYSDYDYYAYPRFDSSVGYAIYGSRYRKASSRKGWGVILTTLATPTLALCTVALSEDASTFATVLGCSATIGCLWGGISLWRSGQWELDWMMDDYVRRYGPRPYASLSAGPTNNGFGLSLTF